MNNLLKQTFEQIIVKDFNYHQVVEVSHETTLEKCCELLKEKELTVLIVKKGKKQGILTNGDILKSIIWDDLASYQKTSGEIATFKLVGLGVNDSLWDAILIIIKKNVRHIPILKANSIIGMIDLMILLEVIINTHETYFKNVLPIKNCFEMDIKHDESDYLNLSSGKLENIFSQKISHVSPLTREMLVVDLIKEPKYILNKMLSKNVKNAVIVEFGFKICGVLNEDDFLKHIIFTKKFNCTIAELFKNHSPQLRPIHSIGNAIMNMYHFNYKEFLLVNDENHPIQVITIIDLFNYMVNIWKT